MRIPKQRVRYSILLSVFILAALLCAGCASQSASIKAYTRNYNTAENLALFQESSLFPLAEGFYESANKYRSAVIIVEEESAPEPYSIPRTDFLTTPQEPFLAVAVRTGSPPVWSVCGGSSESMDLSSVRTLALCIISTSGADYQETGVGASRVFHGSTESARILYLDVQTGTYIQERRVNGKELPKRTTNVPNYTLNDSDLISQIQKDLTLPFDLSPEGEITGGKLGEEYNGYLFPDSVKKITKLEISAEITALALPASLEEIAPGIISQQTKCLKYADPQPVVLTVFPGTRGETFAREGGYVYKRPDDGQRYFWVAGCDCTFDYSHTYADDFPNTPDGVLADVVKTGCLLFVEQGSPAEEYAQAHQYMYSYGDKWERHCCIDGNEWVYYSENKPRAYFLPEGANPDEKWLAEIKTGNNTVIVSPGSPLEEAVSAAGVECWIGDGTAAEREWTDENGLNWRIVYSFAEHSVMAIHIPRDYTQSSKNLDIWQLCKDIGFSSGSTYPSPYPLCYVQPGSWAAENALVWIEEGSTVLHMSYDGYSYNGMYISDYACGVVTEAIDAYFGTFRYGEPWKTIIDHGVKMLYSKSPLGKGGANPFCLIGDPEKMYYWTPDLAEWHINNEKVLESIRVLKISGDMTDEEERSWVLFRAGQESPFLLQVMEGTSIEAFARENGIPYEIWDINQTPFEE